VLKLPILKYYYITLNADVIVDVGIVRFGRIAIGIGLKAWGLS
jgi:hypothetical protein